MCVASGHDVARTDHVTRKVGWHCICRQFVHNAGHDECHTASVLRARFAHAPSARCPWLYRTLHSNRLTYAACIHTPFCKRRRRMVQTGICIGTDADAADPVSAMAIDLVPAVPAVLDTGQKRFRQATMTNGPGVAITGR